MSKKFQIIRKQVTQAGESISVDVDLDKNYNYVEELAIYTNTAETSNLNCQIQDNLVIDDQEVYPRLFDTALLHPVYPNNKYREVGMCTQGKSKLRTTIKDISSNFSAYSVTIMITLSNN